MTTNEYLLEIDVSDIAMLLFGMTDAIYKGKNDERREEKENGDENHMEKRRPENGAGTRRVDLDPD